MAATVLISPLLLPVGYPAWQMRPLVRAPRVLPTDIVGWNDDIVRDSDQAWGYPRQSYKAVGAFLSLTYWVDAKAAKSPITSRQRTVVWIAASLAWVMTSSGSSGPTPVIRT